MRIKARALKKGDVILLYSRKRKEPTRARIREVLTGRRDITFITTHGSWTFKHDQEIETETSRP